MCEFRALGIELRIIDGEKDAEERQASVDAFTCCSSRRGPGPARDAARGHPGAPLERGARAAGCGAGPPPTWACGCCRAPTCKELHYLQDTLPVLMGAA